MIAKIREEFLQCVLEINCSSKVKIIKHYHFRLHKLNVICENMEVYVCMGGFST